MLRRSTTRAEDIPSLIDVIYAVDELTSRVATFARLTCSRRHHCPGWPPRVASLTTPFRLRAMCPAVDMDMDNDYRKHVCCVFPPLSRPRSSYRRGYWMQHALSRGRASQEHAMYCARPVVVTCDPRACCHSCCSTSVVQYVYIVFSSGRMYRELAAYV
ncbi:hypothetical protein BD310DRAFT_371311 [Dichomitus squalens]|uniref:Uncharacterized protein n=1 Tax=Dichomitus squalens TaxID=114155 RepID=A0A4Q9PYQ1_9APHY|nr:hypothetical protein BD310DRAFT_371311 [Dichomitus squalens]